MTVTQPRNHAAEAARPAGPSVRPRPRRSPAADVDALYRVVAGRRDVRNGFLPDPIADDVLTRVLTAAHQAPSVGLSQPWDFIVLRDRAVREQVHALARRQQEVFAAALPGPAGPGVPRPQGGGDPGHPGQHRGDLRPHPRRPGRAGTARPAPGGGVLRPRARCRTSGSPPGPRASAWAGSASSTSGSWPPRWACPPTWRWSPTCAWATWRSSRPRRNWCSAAGPSAGRWPGRCTTVSGAAAACPASSPPACWPTPSPPSGRWTRRPSPRPGSGRRC